MSLWDRPFGPPIPNAASVAGQSAINQQASVVAGPLPVTQTFATNNETLILAANSPTAGLTCAIHPDTKLEQTLFNVIASGYIKTTGAANVTISLYSGPNATANTLGGAAQIGSGTAAQNATTAAWFLKSELIYDSVTQTLVGSVKFYINRTLIAETTLKNFPSAVINTGNPVAQFYLSVQTNTASATTVVVQKFSCG